MERRMTWVSARALIAALAWAGIAPAQPAQTIVWADPADDEAMLSRTVGESPFGAVVGLASLAAPVRNAALSAHPGEDSLVLVSEDEGGGLRLRIRTDGAWGGDQTLTTDAGGAAARGFDAAHEQISGDLLVAYRRAGQVRVYLRTHDGNLSDESSVDLGFASTPRRIALLAAAGSDRVLVVAGDGASLRAAVWDGDAFTDALTLDSAYDNDDLAWDASPDGAADGWLIAWARAAEASLRVRRYASGAWGAEETGPSAGAGIDGVRLAPGAGVTAALMSAGGEIRAATRDAGAWSVPTTLATGVGAAAPMDLAREGAGAGVVAAWAVAGSDRVTVRRWDGSSWSAGALTGTLAGGLAEVSLAPRDEMDGAVILVRAEQKIVVYADAGAADVAGVIVEGLVGEGLEDVDLPASPGASHGASDLSFGNGADATIAPGAYKDLSVGNNATLRFGAGTHIFRSFDSNKNGTRLVCDTSAGDVVIIITDGDFEMNNGLSLERTGANAVVVHVQAGDFIARNTAGIEAAIFVHAGDIDLGEGATIVGHLFASVSVTVGGGTIAPPSWEAPGVPDRRGHEAWALVVQAGSPGAPTALTETPWMASWALPLAISRRVGARAVRVLRWTEVPAFDN